MRVYLAFLVLLFACFYSRADVLSVDNLSNRQTLNINQNWYYHKGALPGSEEAPVFHTKGWERVSLPHSYQLTSINLDDSQDDKTQQSFHRDISWYQKTLLIDAKAGQKIFIEFEGAHQRTTLWVNGQLVGEHSVSAYTPFHFDITQYVHMNSENTITLLLDNTRDATIPPDGHTADYVLFGGLYRDVYLTVTDSLHFTYDWQDYNSGIFITTPTVNKEDATISIRSNVKNASNKAQSFYVYNHIVDMTNRLVTSVQSKHELAPNTRGTFRHTTGIDENLRLWSPDSPYLYRVYTQIRDSEGHLVDSIIHPLGIRKFELRLDEGLLLNGEPIEIIGANRHQHYPYIGDAVPNNLHRNDAIKFKQAGMNLVRLAHYPHDNAFIEACDELGLIVVEEPPTWIEFGNEVWMNNLELATRRMIRNHRNHPSVLGWGAGINHRGTLKRMHYAAKEEDPTRITMNNGTLWTGEQHSGVTDLYAVMDYRGAQRQPDDLLFAMEHSASKDTLKMQEIVSRYKGDPNLIGLASWSAHDSYSFIKRDKQYPNLSVWQAASWDAFRLPKPMFYWYQSELVKSPMVHIPDSRAQSKEYVQVFTNAEEIELQHDDKTIGIFKPRKDIKTQYLHSPSIMVPMKWTSGRLTANALDAGRVVATHSRSIADQASQLSLRFDTSGFDMSADGSSIVLAYAEILDKDGNRLDSDTPPVSFSVEGNGSIVGDAAIGANPVVWRNGVAPIMLRVGDTPGLLTLTASAPGMEPVEASMETKVWSGQNVSTHNRYFYSPLKLAVDFGNPQQHPQEGFVVWSEEAGNASKTFKTVNGQDIEVSVSQKHNSLKWDNTWGMPGDLSFMIEDGVGSENAQPIALSFKGLPLGKYSLKTWHHMLSDNSTEVSPLAFSMTPQMAQIKLETDYTPTYGQKIRVSEAGGGERGDGGSNKGADGYAQHWFHVTDKKNIVLTISPEKKQKKFRLTGFILEQQLTGSSQ